MDDHTDEKPPQSPWVDSHTLARRYGVTPEQVRVWGRTGSHGFPGSVRLSPAVVRWRFDEILAWEESRAEAR